MWENILIGCTISFPYILSISLFITNYKLVKKLSHIASNKLLYAIDITKKQYNESWDEFITRAYQNGLGEWILYNK